MSDQDITLVLETRDSVGKKVKQLRRDGQLPAVIHDHGKQSLHVQASYSALHKIWKEAGKHHPVHLVVGDKKFLALIKDADFEPRKNDLRHIVFNAIEQNKPVETEVPVTFIGDSEAGKAGLMLLRQIEDVVVKALPKDLPDEVTVDISKMVELGDKLHVSDIIVPANVEIITEPEHAVAIVEESRAQAAAEAEEAEAAEAAAAAEAAGEGTAEPGDASAADKPTEE